MHVAVARRVVPSHASSQWNGRWFAAIAVAICLVIRVAVDFEVVGLSDALVLFDILLGLHAVEDGEEHLSCDETVRPSLMLRATADDIELLRYFLETADEVVAVHEGLDV